jgi:molecular chaperone GrpE
MNQEENKQEEVNPTPETETSENLETKNESSEPSAEEKINELNERYLRLYSEFDNFRKRTQREKSDIIKSAGADIVKSILPVFDDLERAIKANETANDLEVVKEGFKLIHHKFSQILTSKGLKSIEVMGAEFNPDVAEAIANIPVEEAEKKGKVIDVVENGYTLNDTVIRFAKVVVGQ